jgi:hypothetical protein
MKSRSEAQFISAVALLLLSGLLAAQTPPASIHGMVKSGNSPLPGVTVTATNTLTGEKVTTSTDVDGSYSFQVPANGRYVVRTQMVAFAPATQEVLINNQVRDARIDLEPVLLSRVPPAPTGEQQQAAEAAALGDRGFQSLTLTQGEDFNGGSNSESSSSIGNSMPGSEVSSATESVAVQSNISTAGWASMSGDEWRQRVQEMREQNNMANGGGPAGGPGGGTGPGGPNGPSFGGGFGGGGFGGGAFGGGFPRGGGRAGRGRFNLNRPHGTLYYSVGDAALDAAPYSLTGDPVAKPGYIQNRFGGAMGGPLNIPKLFNGGNKTFFFLNYNGTRGENPFDQFSTVPTAEERMGIFPNGTVSSIDPVAQRILDGGFIPEPNIPGRTTQNFHFITSRGHSSDNFNLRINHSFGASSTTSSRRPGAFWMGRGNSLSFGIHYQGSHSDLTDPFPSVGGNTDTRSVDVPVAYTRSFGKITNIARVDFNRSRIQTRNLYAFEQNLAASLGISGVSSNPFDWGLPNLSFANFTGLNDIDPALYRNQTLTFGDSMIWTHGKHTLRWGGDFRRIQLNTEASSDARGTFVFTGINTGNSFADFLEGLPQLTSVQFGENNYHFRGNSWDGYVMDEWRMRGNLTLSLGLRYEYVSPFTEISGHIVNLDVAPEFLTNPNFNSAAAVAPVLPGQNGLPATLVKPDRNNFAPRIGIAWKPLSKTVVRTGYGINYNISQYQNIVQQLSFQPPFSVTSTNTQTNPGDLTLENGFPPVQPGTITNNFGVDPDYRLGYVQIWNFDIQQEIRPTLIMNIDYTGTKGTHLDILEAPNRDAAGIRLANVQPFNWETSNGDSHAEAGSIRIRKRLQNGFSIGGTYTYFKSIDDASSIGGGASIVAQDPFNLAAERGLSIFDQRHRFTGDYMIELPFGHDKRWLRDAGFLRTTLGDWQWSGSWTIASGFPFTPRVLADPSDVSRGTNGTLRADLVPGQNLTVSDPSIAEWFNTGAFARPPAGQFGNAGRNIIEGPGSIVFNMAMNKVFQIKEGVLLEFRIQAANVFNTPQYSTIDTFVDSPSFGQVTSVGSMRTVSLSGRFRF